MGHPQEDRYCVLDHDTGVAVQVPTFVLFPTTAGPHGIAARRALRAFAAAIYDTDTLLAQALITWVNKLEGWQDPT